MKTKKNNKLVQLRGLAEKAISDIDLQKRKVVGYFASFNTLDSHNDIIREGAFAKSISERGVNAKGNRRIAHLWQHDMNEPIGKLLELEEDSFGLRFVSEIIDTQKGNDVLTMYQEGVIREHSIGFNYMPDKMEWIDDEEMKGGGYWEIKEVKLFEGSSVTFGANENTPYLGSYKSEEAQTYLNKLFEDYQANISLLKNGKGSDELLQAAEYNLQVIGSIFHTFLDTQPTVKAVKNDTLQEIEEPSNEGKAFFSHLLKEGGNDSFFNHLIR